MKTEYRIERWDTNVKQWIALYFANGAKLAIAEVRKAATLWECRCRAVNDKTGSALIHAGVNQLG